MAVRIELFTITGSGDFEAVAPATLDAAVAAFEAGAGGVPAGGPVACVGWLSASDDDEEALGDWATQVDAELGIALLHQGVGEDAGLAAGAVAADPGPWPDRWSATLRAALAAAAGGRLGWRTNFDPGGTTASAEEYPTAADPG
jgi:hypothetical protein